MCVAMLLCVPAAPAAAQPNAPVVTLTGEILNTEDRTSDPRGTFDAQVTCNADGTGSIAFQVEGIALGPYPGTYTEQGTATFGATEAAGTFLEGLSPILSFTASFKIVSGTTEITGTKQ